MRRMALSEWHYEAIDGEGTPMEIHFRLPLVLIYEQGVSYDEAFGQLAEDEEFLTHSNVSLSFRVGEPDCQQHVSVDLQLCLVVSQRDGSRAADKRSPPCRALFQQVRGINEAQVRAGVEKDIVKEGTFTQENSDARRVRLLLPNS